MGRFGEMKKAWDKLGLTSGEIKNGLGEIWGDKKVRQRKGRGDILG